MQHLIYTGIQRSTKLRTQTITRVTLDVDGVQTVLGAVSRDKGSPVFTALLPNGNAYSINHKTKKQAGGALKKLHDGAEQTSGTLVEDPVQPKLDHRTVLLQDKRDKRNARRRELRKLAKEAA